MYFFNILLLFLILLFNNKLIQTYLKILKYKNIKHLSSKPTLGGFIIISNLFLYFLVSKDNLSEFFILDYHFYIFCFSMLIIFVTGFYDDLFSLDPLKRILIISLILFFFLSAIEYFQLYKLNFTYINYSINIQNISIFFTILCFLILININNMFDGINGQSGLYFIQIVLLELIHIPTLILAILGLHLI